MPPLDKSSLNMRGLIAPSSCTPAAIAADTEGNSNTNIDYALYATFQRLQLIISQGTAVKDVDALRTCSDALLQAISTSAPIDDATTDGAVAMSTLTYFHDPEVLVSCCSCLFYVLYPPNLDFSLQGCSFVTRI
jgi:hypothetical protein